MQENKVSDPLGEEPLYVDENGNKFYRQEKSIHTEYARIKEEKRLERLASNTASGEVSPAILQETQPLLMPMSDAEKREANRQAAAKRLQPNGHYRSNRRRSGVKSPIDNSSAMNGIGKNRSYR